jgi:hypothetical protein
VTGAAAPRRHKPPTMQDVVELARRMKRGRARDLVLGALAEAELRVAFAGEMEALGPLAKKYRRYGHGDAEGREQAERNEVNFADAPGMARGVRRALRPGAVLRE